MSIAIPSDPFEASFTSAALDELRPADTECVLFAPTFAPRGWTPGAAPLPDQKTFDARAAARFPELSAILSVGNVVAAGLFVATTLRGDRSPMSHLDLYLVGVAPSDRWKKVSELLTLICNVVGDEGLVQLEPGVLRVGRPRRGVNRIAIVLQTFDSVDDVVRRFAVPEHGVAYDGRVTTLSASAAYAHVYRVNTVDPRCHSNKYAARLCTDFQAGYAIALPDLRADALAVGGPLVLPHIRLTPSRVCGLFATGDVACERVENSGELATVCRWPEYVCWEQGERDAPEMRMAILAIANNDPSLFMVTKLTSEMQQCDFAALSYVELMSDARFKIAMEDALDQCAGQINTEVLTGVFGFDDVGIAAFMADPKAAVTEPIKALTAKHRAWTAAPAIDWWLPAGAPLAHEPRPESAAEWYSEEFVAREPPAPQRVAATDCRLCCGPARRDQPGHIVLPCGHAFHWGRTESCPGYCEWLDGPLLRDACPVCWQAQELQGDKPKPVSCGSECVCCCSSANGLNIRPFEPY
jgi:hypothetical protein